ncbi:Methionyl-tRNA formyltransferase [bacterium HR39]|nr:Methionyl-tRNA formyltransferase [bacterium HR39]
MARIVLMGTAAFGLPAFTRVAEHPDFEIAAVYTQPPKPAGRGHRLQHTPVHEWALARGIGEIRTPRTLKDPAEQQAFAGLGADLALVAAYGLILPKPVLEAPRRGCVNIHASLLPRWRGAAPIQRAIEAGDEVSGVSFFVMDEGIDTGPLLARYEQPLPPKARAPQLHDLLAELAARHVVEVLEGYLAGRIEPRPQPEEGATYAHRLRREEGHLDFTAPADLLERRIRAFDPWPGTWCFCGEERLLVHDADVVDGEGEPGTVIAPPLVVACGRGALAITRIARAGRRVLEVEAFLRGFPIPVGARLH